MSFRQDSGRRRQAPNKSASSRKKYEMADLKPPKRFRTGVAKPLADGPFIVFDLETTGGNPERNGITEIFAIKVEGEEVLETFYSLVNPGMSIPPIVRKMTGITNKMVRNEPKIHKVMPDFLDFIGSDVLVSHNTIGDMKFVRHYGEQVSKDLVHNFFLCTHLLAERLAPESPDKSLGGLVKFLNLKAMGDAHRAEADGYATMHLFNYLRSKIDLLKIEKIEDAIRLQGDVESGLRLGWAIDDQKIREFPENPGVFFLYDQLGSLLFCSSATNLHREVRKLKNFSQLPRPLMRIALKSYAIKYKSFPNLLDAMIHESMIAIEHKLHYLPRQWHQRVVYGINFVRSPQSTQLSINPIKENATSAYGPIRDRKLALKFLDRLAHVLGTKHTKRGIEIDSQHLEVLHAYFDRRLNELEIKTLRALRSWTLLFAVSRKKVLNQQLKMIDLFHDFETSMRFYNLLSADGNLFIDDKMTGINKSYHIVQSYPVKVRKLQKPVKKSTRSTAKRRTSVPPLTQERSGKINAVLWWIFANRKEKEFFEDKSLTGKT
jgi:DNA polymerase III epsilon subunit family exonuclease